MSHSITHNELILDQIKKFHLKQYENDKIALSGVNGIAVIAGSAPAPTLDTIDNRDGWLFHKWEQINLIIIFMRTPLLLTNILWAI